jgi:hypothetical protein
MSDEYTPKPNFIERAGTISQNWTGSEKSPDELVQEFMLYGHNKRAAALDSFDAELVDADTSNLRRYSKLTALRRNLDRVHRQLRDSNR